MSNYEANPVGFLYERYQSSGVSPLYEVTMTRGQAHAPIFEAVLKEPGGLEVKAQGSSKKIAKNLAAKMMLDMLDGKSKNNGPNDQDNTMQQEDKNNNPLTGSMTDLSDHALDSVTNLATLQSQPTAAASVADFYRRLQKSQGNVLDGLHSGDTCLAEDYNVRNYAPILESLADEQKFEVKFLALESLDGVEQSLVQIMTEGQPHAVTVCLGMGDNSQSSAARCALTYIKLMSERDSEQ